MPFSKIRRLISIFWNITNTATAEALPRLIESRRAEKSDPQGVPRSGGKRSFNSQKQRPSSLNDPTKWTWRRSRNMISTLKLSSFCLIWQFHNFLTLTHLAHPLLIWNPKKRRWKHQRSWGPFDIQLTPSHPNKWLLTSSKRFFTVFFPRSPGACTKEHADHSQGNDLDPIKTDPQPSFKRYMLWGWSRFQKQW